MEESNEVKRSKHPIINDGVYFINCKATNDKNLSIFEKSLNDDVVLANEKINKNANQCFFIKYDENNDCYTIMALHSHLFLSVLKNECYDYYFSIVYQHSLDNKYIFQWDIERIDEEYFNIKLHNTFYLLEFNDKTKLPQLNEKTVNDNQKFSIKTQPIIDNGLYLINPKLKADLLITFPKDLSQKNSFLSRKNDKDKNQLFFIQIDENDGCYSIINVGNRQCLSTDRNSSPKSIVNQKKFNNLDYQKWIISSFDIKSGFFFLELKTNLLRLDASNNENQLHVEICKHQNRMYNHQLFCFKSIKPSDQDKFKVMVSCIKEKQKRRYEKNIKVGEKVTEITDDIFENSFYIETLDIPQHIKKISKNAFINCKRIDDITCDSKWLKLFPNPMNIKYVKINNGVIEIKEDDFKNLRNLKVLYLPQSLIRIHPNAFQNIINISGFNGDPKFLNIIYKYSLMIVQIPNFVTEIPKEAFAGCKSLIKLQFETNSKLKTIKSRAFANCTNLESFEIPKSVENISPDAFQGCNNDFKPQITDKKQKFSMFDNLIINTNVTKITKDYEAFCNITSLEIPLNVTECENNVLSSFKNLKFIKCDPKWLKLVDGSKIETVFIQSTISRINKNDFKNMINLRFIDIPESVEIIEQNSFENCKNLNSIKCGTKHLPFLDQKMIQTLILSNEVTQIDQSNFNELVNLENCILPKGIKLIDDNVFNNCKKLMKINDKNAEKLINNKIFINYGIKEIHKEQFEGWSNLIILAISETVERIDEGTFDDCINLKYLMCDPKWFDMFPKNSITEIVIPDYVKELKKSQINGFDSLALINLPNDIKITEPDIFDPCEGLLVINCKPSLFDFFSEKTKKRCINKKREFNKPNFNFFTDHSNNGDANSIDNHEETSINDLIIFDLNNEKYRRRILEVINYTSTGKYTKEYNPNNTDIFEITKVCGGVCYEIYQLYKIQLRPVQILSILRMADEILNNADSHGSISEIKTGEGKSIIITILSIILVKYGRKIDIITSNMQLAKRDQKEQRIYYDIFGIQTGVLVHKDKDKDFLSLSMIYSEDDDKSIFKSFNMHVFDFPVVYSTNGNFEFVYLHTIFSLNSRNREFDVVIVDEVDNMFIDEYSSPSIIGHGINYAFSNDIFKIVFLLHEWKTTEIIKVLKYYLPCAGKFEEEDIEILKNAAISACSHTKNVNYIVNDGQVMIIDSNTGFKKLGTRWNGYIHEMIEIKEGIEPKSPSVSYSQITQHSYFNLYKKIVGVTGTVGSDEDEDLLIEGYSINVFKVPRHIQPKMKTFVKDRPESMLLLFDSVYKEILTMKNKDRPVLVIWDSIDSAKKFLKAKPSLLAQEILGINQEKDIESIKNAGIAGTVTIATSAAGRGVDIKLSNKSLEAGGLHIIIPMKMASQRSLEQAAGRAGRQGQPGSVTFYKSEKDHFNKYFHFKKGDENLVRLELHFADYLRKNFPWMLQGPRIKGFNNNIFPYACDYSVIFNILARRLALRINILPFEEIDGLFQDLTLDMVQLAWGTFFTKLSNDTDLCDNWDYCKEAYNRFIKELNEWFDPIKSKTLKDAVKYIRMKLLAEIDWEYIVVFGVKITINTLTLIFPTVAPHIQLIGGMILTGGLEVYHQLQNGDNVNWILVLVRAGFSAVKMQILNRFPSCSKLINLGCYTGEYALYNFLLTMLEGEKIKMIKNFEEEEEEYNELNEETSNKNLKVISLTNEITVFTIDTNIWIFMNMKERIIEKPAIKKYKHANIAKFMPKIRPEMLDIKFINMAMNFANESYDPSGNFSIGEKIRGSSKTNEIYKPVFYCIKYANNLYVITRGTKSLSDARTDLDFHEVTMNINGKNIFFHRGFFNAATYVFNSVYDLLTQDCFETIYFIGHSYGAAVSSVLCLLAKNNENLKNRKIFAMAFAPAPAMSFCPSHIAECIFAFINREDIVPSCCLFNVMNSACKDHLSYEMFLRNCSLILKSINNDIIRLYAIALEETMDILKTIFEINVKQIKGVIYRIGKNKNKRLSDCKICESQLPSKLVISQSSLIDHKMNEYIKSFQIIQI